MTTETELSMDVPARTFINTALRTALLSGNNAAAFSLPVNRPGVPALRAKLVFENLDEFIAAASGKAS